ncbi:DNA helicase-2/ATP-dependent DNA helicase PcrA [Edaphobacter lichenicola]|uniref:DNA 3'-5' helicase n=2 Tax=Tunturiibacter TaxID=3154218 RepID=A0A7W8J6G8_9BACT|nr:UvrD-helicase domain-containing protein [Edaphobacter lichenicola]MBB5343438.1 DNA helicase-2/ATP-dependent DNA helicase PcrA [Edaphobacter lichenicola]
MSRLLENMNPQQQEGIRSVDGPVLLLAGAGSGKTRVITHRIAYLIQERGVPADAILAVTFTNKAAKEMAERVDRILGHSSLAKPMLATFHSFCVRVLRRDIEALRVGGVGLTKTFAIYDETDQQAVVKQALKRLAIDDKTLKPRVALGRISWAKNHMIDPQEYFLASTNPMEEKIAHIFEIYKKELFKANALDFDDLLLETVRLLKSSEETRERYNRRYKYLLIDEYQDTNRPQYELMKLLAGPDANVCVVGDEDQSIYSWRGADIKNILEFEKDFPETKTIRLEQNYRSTQVILEGAGAVVAQNTQRKGKNLFTTREGGSLIGYYEAPDGENEALFIADRIQRYLREAGGQVDLPRCAVLYRTNSQSRLVEEALRRYQIQYHMVGGFSFYDRAEVKDILSYLKLVQNVHDSVALGRVVNSPPRGIGKTTMETLERMALSSGISTWDAIGRAIEDKLLPARGLQALGSFRRLIEDARAMLGPGFAEKLTEDLAHDSGASLLSDATEEAEADVSFRFGDPESDDKGANTSFDTSFNFGFDFGPSEEFSTIAAENSLDSDAAHGIDSASFNPFAPVVLKKSAATMERAAEIKMADEKPAFRKPGDAATLPELIKFLNDRSGYIRALEEEATPESFSRIENLKELANAAQDAQERGETLHEFLDHAALVSDADSYSEEARVTLMTLHAAKGLEFPLVFLSGMEEGLFPHSRTLTDPTGLEEERRLCYVGMTRAMDTLIMTRARYRRRYGSDMPESSIASRFLEEVPSRLVEDLGSPPAPPQFSGSDYGSGYGGAYATPYPKANRFGRPSTEQGDQHYSYEDEDQSGERAPARPSGLSSVNRRSGYTAKTAPPGQSMDNIASFFAARGQKISRPKPEVQEQTGKTGLKQGSRVRHPKYGEGTVFRREGDGDDAKITVQFQQHGVKKLVEKFAQLERL